MSSTKLPVRENGNYNPLDGWHTKEEAMEFFRVGKTTFGKYLDLGLKHSQIGSIIRVHADHINEFLRKFIK